MEDDIISEDDSKKENTLQSEKKFEQVLLRLKKRLNNKVILQDSEFLHPIEHTELLNGIHSNDFNNDIVINNGNNDDSDTMTDSSLLCNSDKENVFELTLSDINVLVDEFQLLNNKFVNMKIDVDKTLEIKEKKYKEDIEKKEESCIEQINVLSQEKESLNTEMKDLLTIKDAEVSGQQELNIALTKTITRLENDITEQKKMANEASEKLTTHDAAAKRAISVIQKEMGARIEQVTKMYEDSVAEKDAYIIKMSKLEVLIDELQKNNGAQSKKSSNQHVELDRVSNLLRTKELECTKLSTANDSLEKKLDKYKENSTKHKEELEGCEMKTKWAQNKLKTELDAHKESKKLITQLNSKIQESKEERDQIQKNCQEMIARYQGDEEIESVRLNKEIAHYENKLKEHIEEVNALQKSLKSKDEEVTNMKDNQFIFEEKVICSEKKIKEIEESNMNLNKLLDEQVKDNAELKTYVDSVKDKVKELQACKDKIKESEQKIEELENANNEHVLKFQDLASDLLEQQEKQEETMLFSRSLTENNVQSKSMVTDLQSKLDDLLIEKEEIKNQYNNLERTNKIKIDELQKDRNSLNIKLEDLLYQLEQKTNALNELTSALEESKNELKVYKKKNASQLKDLQKQLHQSSRKLEHFESTSNGSVENLSLRSRTSSCTSLERVHDSPPGTSPQMHHEPIVIPQVDHYINQPRGNNNQYAEIEVDKKVLVERICKLQRNLAKKNEKVEFMQEHILQLTEDLQKKSRIIQYYISKEETGTLASNQFDRNKADAAQHGGIMASVYSAKATDKKMTLDLSLTINRQLQAVLEDAILKNIMLKENINTLGMEIAKLQAQIKPT